MSRDGAVSDSATGDALSPGRVGQLALRGGRLLVAAALPLAVVAFLALVATAPSPSAGVAAALAAFDGSVAASGGLAWLFHVGALGVLAGAWILGLGLVLSGLFD